MFWFAEQIQLDKRLLEVTNKNNINVHRHCSVVSVVNIEQVFAN